MSSYEILLFTHVSCVVVSASLFVVRFALLNRHPERPLAKPLKVFPHIVDTVLLGAAIGMLALTTLNPFQVPWLTAKIGALLAYIIVGAICLRALPGSQRQNLAFVAAVTIFAYIVLVALSKQVVPLNPG